MIHCINRYNYKILSVYNDIENLLIFVNEIKAYTIYHLSLEGGIG